MKKEGSQSAMRLCMGSRRGFIARIKVSNMLTLMTMMRESQSDDDDDVTTERVKVTLVMMTRMNNRVWNIISTQWINPLPHVRFSYSGTLTQLHSVEKSLHCLGSIGRAGTIVELLI